MRTQQQRTTQVSENTNGCASMIKKATSVFEKKIPLETILNILRVEYDLLDYEIQELGEKNMLSFTYLQKDESTPAQSMRIAQELPPEEKAVVQAIKDDLPSAGEMLKGFAKSAFSVLASGVAKVDEEVYESRIILCARCEHLYPEQFRCTKCGCFMKVKASFEAMKCPIGKW